MDNAARATDTQTETATDASAGRAAWPAFFGTLTELVVREGRKGRYAKITLDCKSFTKTAMVFKEDIVDQLIAAGENTRIWIKGPVEQVTRSNGNGGTYRTESLKVIYFKNKDLEAAEKGEAGETAEAGADQPAVAGQADADAPAAGTEQPALATAGDDEVPF